MTREEEMNCWRPVEDYEGIYEVNIPGQVRSVDRIDCRGYRWKGKVLSPGLDRHNYLQVVLSKNGKGKTRKVHQLVAKAFPEICGEFFDGCEIDHLDNEKLNNNAYNLRVKTHQQNMNNPGTREAISKANKETWRDPVKGKKLREGRKKASVKIKKPIVQLSLTGRLVGIWGSTTDAVRKLGFGNGNISKCCTGKYKKAYGYKWMYLKDYCNQQIELYIKYFAA